MAMPRPETRNDDRPAPRPATDATKRVVPRAAYLAEVERAGEELAYAAGILLQADEDWPDYPGAVAATIMVENVYRHWCDRQPSSPRLRTFHSRWLIILRLLADSMPIYRRAVGSRDVQLTGSLIASLHGLFNRAASIQRAMVRVGSRTA